jgi:hypothetical protein
VSEEARKSQNALSDGVAGVVNSPKGSAETPPADNGNKTLVRYDAGKALNLKKNVDNMNRAFAEGADEVADASLENHSPAGIEQGKGNDLPSSQSVLPVKTPVPPTSTAPLTRSRRLGKIVPNDQLSFIKEQQYETRDAKNVQGGDQQAARLAFTENPTSSSAGDDHSKHSAKKNTHIRAGPGARTSPAPQDPLFQKGKAPEENNRVENAGDIYVQDDDDEIRNRGSS